MATDGDPLVAIQNAALERALLAETDSSAYVLLAGALERARLDEAATGDVTQPCSTDETASRDSSRPHSTHEDAEPSVPSVLTDDANVDADRVAGSLLTATLTATLAVRHGLGTGSPSRPPSPSVAGPAGDGDRRRRLLLEGAMLARDRFDATTAEAADLAEVGVAAFERHLDRRS